MKKSLMLLSLGLGLTLSLAGAETYQEAFKAAREAGGKRNLAEAEKLYLEAEKLAGNENEKASCQLARIDILRATKHQEDALKLSQSMKIDEITHPGIRINAVLKLARGYRELKQYDEAEKTIRDLLAQNDGRLKENILSELGYTLMQAKKLDEAEKVYREAAQVETKNINLNLNIKLNLARVLNAEKKYEEAEKLCQEVLKDENKKPGHLVDAYTILGDSARYSGDKEKCKEYYGKAIAIPECPAGRKASLEKMIEKMQ